MMKDWQKLILLYLAGRKTPATPKNIEQHLKKHDISKSLTAIKTACQESLSSFMICYNHSTYNDDGTVRQSRFKYSLKPEPDTLTKLLDTFVGTEHQKEFLASEYCKHMTRDWSPYGLVEAPPPMTDFLRSIFDADKKDFPDACNPSFPIDAEIVSIAVPQDEAHRIVGEKIIEHAAYLAQMIYRFYPELRLNVALIGFLGGVQRARQCHDRD